MCEHIHNRGRGNGIPNSISLRKPHAFHVQKGHTHRRQFELRKVPRGPNLPRDGHVGKSLVPAFWTTFSYLLLIEKYRVIWIFVLIQKKMCGSAVMVCMLSRRQVPGSQLFSFQIGHQGLITGTHPLGTNYLPEVAEGYFVTELKPLEAVGHRSVVKIQ